MSHIKNSVCPTCNSSTPHSFTYIGVMEIFNKPCILFKLVCIDCTRIKLNTKQPLTPLRRIEKMPVDEWYRLFLCK
jgi:hypothetical protein